MRALFFIILFATFFGGISCGISSRTMRPVSENSGSAANSKPDVSDKQPQAYSAASVSSIDAIQASLMQAYRDWKGTPYMLGGSTKRGVDCSRLVHIIFDDYFDIQLPNNTRRQLSAGDGIRRSAVRTGDLIFFRTGRKTLHVGIAVNRGEFLHASSSNGVMISKLGNRYWRNKFLAARRVF